MLKTIVSIFIVATTSYANGDINFKIKQTDNHLFATPPEKHHFNINAPMELKIGESSYFPTKATEEKIDFILPLSKETSASLTLYLCDDAKTYCKKKQKELKLSAVEKSEAVSKPAENSSRLQTKQNSLFMVNDPEAAYKKSKETGKPVMIDFFGIWCPPCNQLDEEVFSSPTFKKAADEFVLLKMDVDQKTSWELKSKYNIGGYPTILFTDSQGNEISRFVGARKKEAFVREMKKSIAFAETSSLDLEDLAEKGDLEAKKRLGLQYLNKSNWRKAEEFLKDIPGEKQNYYFAKIGLVEEKMEKDPSAKKEVIEAYTQSINEFPDTALSAHDAIKVAGIDAEKEKFWLEKALKITSSLIRKPANLRDTEYSLADVYSMQAEIYKKLGNAQAEKLAWKKTAKEYDQLMKKNPKGKSSRAYLLEQAYALSQSGESKNADRIYLRMIKKYPEEFTFYFAYGKKLYREKKYGESVDQLRKAHLYSYGDNRLRVVEALAKSEIALGQNEKALSLVRSEIQNTALPSDKSVRTHKYISDLKSLEKTLVQ